MNEDTKPYVGMRVQIADFRGVVTAWAPMDGRIKIAWIKNIFQGQPMEDEFEWTAIAAGIDDEPPSQDDLAAEYLKRFLKFMKEINALHDIVFAKPASPLQRKTDFPTGD